jgi:hypothetical protein
VQDRPTGQRHGKQVLWHNVAAITGIHGTSARAAALILGL